MNSYIVLTFKKEFNFIIEIYKMNKNKTLLLKMFECGRLNPLIFEETTPLLTL